MERVLLEAKRLNKCVVVHAYTKKGKGYVPAEKNPAAFHGIGAVGKKAAEAYHEAFSEDIVRIAEGDEKILAVTAAMGIGTGLDAFEKTYPKRYFDVGIAEEHALTFAAGLAASGYKPFVAIYSTFLQRGYDNILHDIALQKLPVKIMIDRAGMATADGATHHGIFDVAFLSQIPGVSIYAPSCFKTLSKMVDFAAESDSAVAIRYPNAGESPKVLEAFYSDGDFDNFTVRGDFELGDESEILFVTYGNIASKVIEAKEKLTASGVKAGIVLAEQLKPQGDAVSFIKKNLGSAKAILFVEEGIKNGGFSMICANELRKLGVSTKIDIAAIDDNFASPTVKCDLYDFVGLSADAIYNRAITLLGE
jgi:1-deoxy-D-xylulose-5-phosphate synthase